MEEIVKNHFETLYKEYKEYEAVVENMKKDIKEQQETFKSKVLVGEEDDMRLVEELFDISIKPIQSESDLAILRNRVLSVYDAYKIIIDFPVEIIDEMKSLKRPYQVYRIDKGIQIDIDKETNEKIKAESKKKQLEYIKAMKLNQDTSPQ